MNQQDKNNMKKDNQKSQIVIYKAENGKTKIEAQRAEYGK